MVILADIFGLRIILEHALLGRRMHATFSKNFFNPVAPWILPVLSSPPPSERASYHDFFVSSPPLLFSKSPIGFFAHIGVFIAWLLHFEGNLNKIFGRIVIVLCFFAAGISFFRILIHQ